MPSYYDTTARIRYYGQMPDKVGKTSDSIWGTGIKSAVFGADVLTADWHTLLEVASDQPVDLSRRKEPVHEALANLAVDIDSLYLFTKSWGFLDADLGEKNRFFTRPRHVAPFQERLQRAWRGERDALEEIAKDVKARVDVNTLSVDIAVIDLWSLVRLLFLRDHSAGSTKVCANPDCSSPYFVQQRRGQKFCTHKCAVLMNVRRFREREGKSKSRSKRRTR
jgi:hypothetical protein